MRINLLVLQSPNFVIRGFGGVAPKKGWNPFAPLQNFCFVVLVRYVFTACIVWVLLVSCGSQVSHNQVLNNNQIHTRILLIGNSYTYFNDGIDQQLQGLAPASRINRIALGGYALENHWNDENTRHTIQHGNWGYVVLQEQSQIPVFDRAKFREFAGKLDQAIKSSGAKTVLFMTWERPDSVSDGVTTANLAAAYDAVGAELGAKVAPVGLAFARSLAARPDFILYSEDGHPTPYGTYLATCVLYSTIFNQSPVGNPYAPPSIPTEIREYLQRIAAASVAK